MSATLRYRRFENLRIFNIQKEDAISLSQRNSVKVE